MAMQEGSSSPWSRSIRSFDNESSDSEDDMDWEEVAVGILPTAVADNETTMVSSNVAQAGHSQPIEVTLDTPKKKQRGRHGEK